MLKKLAITAASAAILFAAALPAFAGWPSDWDVTIVGKNQSEAIASTGSNTQVNVSTNKAKAWKGGEAENEGGSVDQRIKTGDAKAKSSAVVAANTHIGCGCEEDGHVDVAYVKINKSTAYAETGWNTQVNTADNKAKAWKGGEAENEGGSVDQRIRTGNASARSSTWVVINTHVGFDD